MLRDMLRQDGHAIGRKHVATLMKRMTIEAVYKKPNTSRRHPAHAVYPYLLRHVEISRPNHVFAAYFTYIPSWTLSIYRSIRKTQTRLT